MFVPYQGSIYYLFGSLNDCKYVNVCVSVEYVCQYMCLCYVSVCTSVTHMSGHVDVCVCVHQCTHQCVCTSVYVSGLFPRACVYSHVC